MKPIQNLFQNRGYPIPSVLILESIVFAGRASAQGFGKIVGAVTDTTGAVVNTATITATQEATGRVTAVNSNAEGAYVFPSLPPAT